MSQGINLVLRRKGARNFARAAFFLVAGVKKELSAGVAIKIFLDTRFFIRGYKRRQIIPPIDPPMRIRFFNSSFSINSFRVCAYFCIVWGAF